MTIDDITQASPAEPTDAANSLKWPAFLFILLALALQVGRILQVESRSGNLPFLSANDRSRWCTIEALAGRGSYEIEHLIFENGKSGRRTDWYSIDLVRHRGTDGQMHYYSSKPTLLPTLYAGLYWLLSNTTGMSLLDDPFPIARIMLLLVNLLPLAAFWWIGLRWYQQHCSDGWSIMVMAAMLAWGTYLSTFVISLNNHLPAALAVALSLWCIDRVALRGDSRIRWFLLCGLATSFGAANELPALSWVAAAGGVLFFVSPGKTLLAYLPALLPVAAAFFGSNYLAHGVWTPAYAHRDVGPKLIEFDVENYGQLEMSEVVTAMEANGYYLSNSCSLRPARRENTFEVFDEANQKQYALRVPTDDSLTVTVFEWDDWYDYPDSYWAGERPGVDNGEPNRSKYIFHCLVGHHGIFSLTPFWLLSILGVFAVLPSMTQVRISQDLRLIITGAIVTTTIVVLMFYFLRGQEDRNFGGITSGLRWAFWMIPLWLWLATASLELKPGIYARRFIELLLAISVFSACYPWRNPWTSPWIMQFMEYWNLPV